MKRHQVKVEPLPSWMDATRLLGPGAWTCPEPGVFEATLDSRSAADLSARLRGLGFGGCGIRVAVEPPLGRTLVREARRYDAVRRRGSSPGFTRSGVRMDDEGRMSLTHETLALRMADRAAPASVLDLGCGVGGNAIAFARRGCVVTAVEKDARRLEMARHNAEVYEVASRIEFAHGDALEQLHREADITFVDPPWGADYDRVRTTMADIPLLASMVARLRGTVWLKLPPSFDTTALPGFTVEPMFGVSDGDDRRVKFLWLRSS